MTMKEIDLNNRYWKLLRSGATFRKWYGCLLDVVFWKNDGELIKSMPNSTMRNPEYMYKPCITWSKISSGDVSVRYSPQDILFDAVGLCGFAENDILFYGMGLYNSKVGNFFIRITNASMSILTSDLGKIPYIEKNVSYIVSKVKQNINISKQDWDSHELSLDYDSNPLIAIRNEKIANVNTDIPFILSASVEQFKNIWEERFNLLHQNEEELNRQFIEIYGLQDELSPKVPKNEITILQQGEINLIQFKDSDDEYTLQWNEDVLMKQLISYAVGVWMGRYKLGSKGLHIAHPNPTDKELQEYWYGGIQVQIDDDGLIPVLPQNSPFDDNLSSRLSDFVRIVFGEENLTENLNYIEQKLGTSIDQYVQKDFWKDHKKMYQNRPIYWLFSSKKGAFKCLAYMHRMDAYTAERVRSNYLLPYIEFLQNQVADLENRAASLSTTENRKLQNIRKALDECREYHERLQVVAEQAIAFDLDDGVIVNYAKFGDVLAKLK